ncbi:MAG: hypothetical protein HDT27_04435 [Subdoligranulum sp.]|nr:hypothetical protein [Subdoligranulum sp.]
MDVIINDFSLDGQFKDAEEFFDSLSEKTLPAFCSLDSHGCEILSSFETYNRKVSVDLTLYDTLRSDYRGYPEATKLKILLTRCINDPYWENESQTDEHLKYSMDDKVFEKPPNCFTEAFAREKMLLSFQNQNFASDKLAITVDGKEQFLYNLFNKESVGQVLFCKNVIGLSELLMSMSYGKKVCFFENDGRYYADAGFEEGRLTIEDGLSIFENFKMSIENLCQGKLSSRFSDSINHKGITYYEFRCSLQDSREFRIYYFLDHDKLVYLNSLCKKTNKTPSGVKDQSVALIKKYWDKAKK